MKQLLKNAKSICALVLTVVLLMSMSTVAFAADNTIDTEEDNFAVLVRINAEYGTNIRVLSEKELVQYGLTSREPQAAKSCESLDLEETLRYIAEVQIPQFERTTQEAIAVKAMLFNEVSEFGTAVGTVVAIKAIDYATAAVEAYITNDSYGNTVWGSIVKSYCIANPSQSTSFIPFTTSATHMDDRKTIYWTGEGDYVLYLNGTYYYLYSGTQYASMYVEDYD